VGCGHDDEMIVLTWYITIEDNVASSGEQDKEGNFDEENGRERGRKEENLQYLTGSFSPSLPLSWFLLMLSKGDQFSEYH